MGHYFGCATRLRVKKTAAPQVIEFLDYLFDLTQTTPPAPRNQAQEDLLKATSTLQSMLSGSGGAAYFETWRWRVKEDKDDHWLYESRASTKYVSMDLLVMLLNGISESLLIESGEIVCRSLYESGAVEDLVFAVAMPDGDVQFEQREGCRFDVEFEFVTDSNHPRTYALSSEEEALLESGDYHTARHEDEFEWPWTVAELEAEIKRRETRKRRLRTVNNPWR